MNSLVVLLGIMSLKASALVVVILLVKKVFARMFTPKQHYMIWIMLFLVLTIPKLPKSSISIYGLIAPTQTVAGTFNMEKEFVESIRTGKVSGMLFEEKDVESVADNTQMPQKMQVISTEKKGFDIYKEWMFLVWMTGAVIFASVSVIKMCCSIKMAKREIQSATFELEGMLNQCREQLKIKREVKAVFSNRFPVPCIFGVWRPVIFIPERLRNMDENRLRMIVLHELAHCKRNDIAVKIVILVYQWVYWFNPMVLQGFRKMKSDMEPACDYMVLENIERYERAQYGRALLDVLEKLSEDRFHAVSVGIAESKIQLRRRIIMIGRYKKNSKLAIVMGLLVMLLIGCSFVSEPNTLVQESTPAGNEQAIGKDAPKIQMTKELAERLCDDRDSVVGKDVNHILSGHRPYVSTYYLNTKGITYNQTISDLVRESVYPIMSSEESSGLYVYMDSMDKILDIRIDEFNGMTSESYRKSDYVVNFYDRISGIYLNKDLSEDEITGFSGEGIYDFQEKFDTGNPTVVAKDRSGSTEIRYYRVYFEEMAEPMAGVYILTKDSKILNIKIDEPNFLFDRIEEHFGKSVPKGFFPSPEKITVYSGGMEIYGKYDHMYEKLMENFKISLAEDANTLRADDLNKYIKDIKSGKHGGVEFLYSKTMKIMYPDIDGEPITYEFDSIFVTVDEYAPMMAFGIKGDYGTAPIYMADKNPLVEFIKETWKSK